MIVRNVKATLFLEGIGFPFTSMTLSMAQGQPNTLVIDVAPLRELFDIFPRTLVQVFYDDGNGPSVFFEGEVVAHSFCKNAQGRRQMILTCQDFSNYWLYSYVFFLQQGLANQTTSMSFLDEVTLFTGLDASQFNSGSPNKRLFPVRGIGDTARQFFSGPNKDIVAGLRDLLKSISGTNAFFADRFAKLKIPQRLFAMPDGQLQWLVDSLAFYGLQALLGQQDSHETIFYALNLMLQMVFQNFNTLSLPSLDPLTKNPINFAFTPASNFMTAPPRCNVIFPDMHDGFDYNRNLLSEPTRLEYALPPSPVTEWMYFSPPGFRALIEQVKTAQQENKVLGFQNLLIKDPNPELDETLRGIVPIRLSVMRDEFQRVRAGYASQFEDKAAAEAKIKAVTKQMNQSIADFEFLLKKFETRGFPANMAFNPNIHPAFPVLMLDGEARLFGSPRVVVHTLDSQGHAGTTVDCTYARHKDVIGDVIANPPPWINRSFIPAAIGNDSYSFTDLNGTQKTVQGAYPAMMGNGMRSILDVALPEYDANGVFKKDRLPTSQADAADLLFGKFQHVGDKGTFIAEYTRRAIQTQAQSLAFLGITQVNNELLDGPIYDVVKRKLIQSAKLRLAQMGNAVREV